MIAFPDTSAEPRSASTRSAERVNEFAAVYAVVLADTVTTRPDLYVYGIDEVPTVARKMHRAFLDGSYNHDGHAIRRTCKQLGIKHTRKAMEAFFNGEAQ